MNNRLDLVIRGGQIADGSGRELREADIGVIGGKISEVGNISAVGAGEIDAKGLLVTPGFVDIHTHYDGQVTWDSRLAPSSNHGVTTALMGNCGVGFAPCRPSDIEMLVKVMEGVEDIPEVVMAEGIPWNWETFPQYLDAVEARSFDIDCATQVPHAAVRVYVMGERGARGEPASSEELEKMTTIVAEGMSAGALGVSSSRTLGHRTVDGRLAPHVKSGKSELIALADGLRRAQTGVFQMITNVQDWDSFGGRSGAVEEVGLLTELAAVSGRPISFTLVDVPHTPKLWKEVLSCVEKASAAGVPIKGQIYPRPVGVLFGLDLSLNPFSLHPSYRAVAHLPLIDRVRALRQPSMRSRLLSEKPDPDFPNPVVRQLISGTADMYIMRDPPNYEPPPEDKLAALAARSCVSPLEIAYDLLLGDDGRAMLFLPGSNYTAGNLDDVFEMLMHDDTLIGLGDGGAHYGMICDSSFPTSLLAHWTRDRCGERISVPHAVQLLSRKNALAIGLRDRGLIAPGCKADINVIDYDHLQLRAPYVTRDLPTGAPRLMQKAEGYRATIVAGQVTYRDGGATGAMPGRLVRGAR